MFVNTPLFLQTSCHVLLQLITTQGRETMPQMVTYKESRPNPQIQEIWDPQRAGSLSLPSQARFRPPSTPKILQKNRMSQLQGGSQGAGHQEAPPPSSNLVGNAIMVQPQRS
uniref:Uncharacterized protein n=1 Tax=Opuntia streptacantha TaxID=393608 RepID=A0A7C9A0U2_OPUST